MLQRAGRTQAGSELLAGFIDRLQSAGLDRATAHLAWHAVLTLVVGSLSQELALHRDQTAAFEAVLDVTIAGLSAGERRPSPTAVALLAAHRQTDG